MVPANALLPKRLLVLSHNESVFRLASVVEDKIKIQAGRSFGVCIKKMQHYLLDE